jgi:hypothetical protein
VRAVVEKCIVKIWSVIEDSVAWNKGNRTGESRFGEKGDDS